MNASYRLGEKRLMPACQPLVRADKTKLRLEPNQIDCRNGEKYKMERLIDGYRQPTFRLTVDGYAQDFHKPANELLAVEQHVKNGEKNDDGVNRCV